jgi:hypothetical protein
MRSSTARALKPRPAPAAPEPKGAAATFDALAAIRAIRDARGQKTDKAVLLMLVSRSNRLGVSFPTVAKLAHDVGTSERDVQRSLSRLHRAGLLEVLRTPQKSNIYQLSLDALRNPRRWAVLGGVIDGDRHGDPIPRPTSGEAADTTDPGDPFEDAPVSSLDDL